MTRRHRSRSRAAFTTASLSLALLAGTVGCTNGDDGRDDAGDGVPVIAPGKPGEDATTVSPDEAKAAHRKQHQPNGADFEFMTMMIEHHKQALAMSELAARHADDERVARIADRIETAQRPEIKVMRAWLKRNKADQRASSGHEGHEHGSMPGMATREQLADLRTARGKKFDQVFLTLMSTHHEGAVTMAREVLTKGNDVTAEELATEIAAQQKAEIGRMRALR